MSGPVSFVRLDYWLGDRPMSLWALDRMTGIAAVCAKHGVDITGTDAYREARDSQHRATEEQRINEAINEFAEAVRRSMFVPPSYMRGAP